MTQTTVIDCTGSNVGAFTVPSGAVMAGYDTGSGGVPWTPAQFSRYPRAVHIDQSPVNTPADETSDVYDLESRAGTVTGLPGWVHQAWTSYTTARRPGQRTPAVYCNMSTVTAAVNALAGAGITHGVNLWVAGEMPQAAAEKLVDNASGPFPVIGVQYQFLSLFDVSTVSDTWLRTVSGKPAAPPAGPGTQQSWRWCRKCQGLFYSTTKVGGVCPAGGSHDGTQSHNYNLGYLA